MRKLLIGLCALILVACGGGGGTSVAPPQIETSAVETINSTPAVNPIPTALSFNTCKDAPTEFATSNQYTLINNVYDTRDVPKYSTCMAGVIDKVAGLTGVFDWSFESKVYSSKAYPEIVFGWKPYFMKQSNTAKLPQLASALPDIITSGTAVTACAAGSNCLYDTAYDLWFENSAVPTEWKISTEMMIWTDTNRDTSNDPGYITDVTIDGKGYKLFHYTLTHPVNNESWNYVAYIAKKPSSDVAVNIRSFVADSVQRGFVKSTEYLESVEFGPEIIMGTGKTTVTNYKIQ
jgi:hypothetical protein